MRKSNLYQIIILMITRLVFCESGKTCLIFSGGGMRSAYLTNRVLNHYKNQNWEHKGNKISLLAGLSGGAWRIFLNKRSYFEINGKRFGFMSKANDDRSFRQGLIDMFNSEVQKPDIPTRVALAASAIHPDTHYSDYTRKVPLINFCYYDMERSIGERIYCPWARSWFDTKYLDSSTRKDMEDSTTLNPRLEMLFRSGSATDFNPTKWSVSTTKPIPINNDFCKIDGKVRVKGFLKISSIMTLTDAGAYSNIPVWLINSKDCEDAIAFDFSSHINIAGTHNIEKTQCGLFEYQKIVDWCNYNEKCCYGSEPGKPVEIQYTSRPTFGSVIMKINGVSVNIVQFNNCFGKVNDGTTDCCLFSGLWQSTVTNSADLDFDLKYFDDVINKILSEL